MSKHSKKSTNSSIETQEAAMKVAKATQRKGQTKEQTKMIAQGVQKGIDLYKKQQKERARELNKKLKKVSGKLTELDTNTADATNVEPEIIYRQSLIPWIIVGMSWIGFIIYFINLPA